MRFRLLVLSLAIASTAGVCDQKIPDAPPTGLRDQQVTIEPSTVQVPLAVSLSFIKGQLEAAVPRSLSAPPYNEQINGGADNCDGGGVSFGYGISRSPIAVSASANTIGLSFGAEYWVEARARPKLLFVCGPLAGASCGVGEEPRRTANLSVAVPISMSPDWKLSAAGARAASVPTNRCIVTIFQKDVTDQVMAAFQQRLQQQANGLNEKLQQIGVRTRVESAWQALLQPISIAPQTWLTVNPAAFSVSALAGQGDSIGITLGMSANPIVSVGARPQAAQRALPDVAPVLAGNGFHLAVPVIAQTMELTKQLRSALKIDDGGIRYPPTGRFYVQPDAAELWAYGTRAVVRIRFKGSAKGTLYLTGTPTWDGATNTLSVPDLDYTLETKNLLARLASWAEGDRFRNDLRNRLRLNLAPQIDQARALAQQALNRNLGVVQLSGSVTALRVPAIYVHPGDSSVRVLAVADGMLRADIQ